MEPATRRVLLAASGAVAAGTVAALALWRKPPPPVATLQPGAGPGAGDVLVRVGTIAALKPADPPAPPAAAVFHAADGTERRLSDYAGRGLIVNLWATWCVPCVAEMPELQTLARTVAGEGILVLPLSSDRGGAATVEKFYARIGIDALPVLLDPKGAAARAWGVRGLPTTLVIDRQGREQGRVEGAIDWASAATIAELRRLVG